MSHIFVPSDTFAAECIV